MFAINEFIKFFNKKYTHIKQSFSTKQCVGKYFLTPSVY